MTLGFVGTGTIARAFIEGLRRKGETRPVVVSPRSESISKDLVARLPDVRRAASNAEVVEASDVIFLAMRPAQVEEALDGVRFRPGQLVISFIAGLSTSDLQGLAPESRVGRVLPLPPIAYGEGPVICFPAHAEIVALLEGMGDVIVAESDEELRSLSSISGFMSSYFELQLGLVDWLSGRGMAPERAAGYATSLLAGLAQTSLRTPADGLAALVEEHQTKGGLNQRVRQQLLDEGWFKRPVAAFEQVLSVRRQNLK